LNPKYFGCFTFIFVSIGESCLLVLWCAGAVWCAATMIMTGVGDLVQMIRNDRIGRVLGDRVSERSDGAMYGLHHACRDEERVFLG
jgi:hypothetical protein